MPASSDAVSMIGSVPIFAGLNENQRKAVASEGKEMSYSPGTSIVKEGTMGVGFFLILDGKAEVRKGEKVLANLAKGQFFGEMSLIDDEPRSADVVAVAPTKCWAITSWAYAAVTKEHPEIAHAMLKELVKRLRKAQTSPTS
ncbi:MAG: cyclic nucleotide-binding domain-containing protein [archaeon]|nr:MAG: cyclic nucleotide-binding domain-containing protein [archaeon]